MKKFLLSLTMLFYCVLGSNAQEFTSYTSEDVYEKHAKEVEELSSDWIKTYNRFKSLFKEDNDTTRYWTLYLVNLNKAWNNLLDAPPVIIDYSFGISDSLSTNIVNIELINSTPKIITEITFTFTFEYYDKEVYDINTGDNNLIIKFNNIKGRPNNLKSIIEISNSHIINCYHLLNYEDASYVKPFYNKKANTITLKDISIKFDDGTFTKKVAIFNEPLSLQYYGPLSPIFQYTK